MITKKPFTFLFHNIAGGYDCRDMQSPHDIPKAYALDSYIAHYKQFSPDIVSLVEVHLENKDGSSQMVEEMSTALALPYCKSYSHSSSHIDKNKFLGTAILSKYPINQSRLIKLPNPHLTYRTPKGDLWNSHDKYVQESIVDFMGNMLQVRTFQGLPFHKFGQTLYDPDNPRMHSLYRDNLSHILTNAIKIPTIIAGDFNTVGVDVNAAFPAMNDNSLAEVIKAPTMPKFYPGEQPDNIFYTSSLLAKESSQVVHTLSDHEASVASFSISY